MIEPMYIDTETCGRFGMPVLLQYAVGDGEIQLYSFWKNKISKTLALLEMIVNHEGGLVFFNAAFDWFHLTKVYTTFKLAFEKLGDIYPDLHINEIAVLEEQARDLDICLKPVKVLDLMLQARKGELQSIMNRDPINIRRVPTAIAWDLAKELEKRVPLPDICFAKTKGVVEKWKVRDIVDHVTEEINPHFKNIVCKFNPSGGLKAFAVHILGEKDVLKYSEIECDIYPEELGYAPFALAIGTPDNWKNSWPDVIHHHIQHWAHNDLARQYGTNDIKYTRGLYKYLGCPPMSDDDSVLACQVASVRWRGLKVDIEGIKQLREEAIVIKNSSMRNGPSVRLYMEEVMNNEERLIFADDGSTKKAVLEDIRDNWKDESGGLHKAAQRAKEILAARKAEKEVQLYDKLILAGRFHPSFIVIGTKSSRMSGSDGLNPQGINHSRKVRSRFPFAWDGFSLDGGDFSSFEVSLAAAVYKDPLLDEDLKLGKKMAGLFGEMFFPEESYEDILESEGSDENDMYDKAKRGMYSFFYGGTSKGMSDKLGFDQDRTQQAIDSLMMRYKGIGRERSYIESQFSSLRQAGGIGTKVEWVEPSQYVESPLGFRRFFTLENQISKALFELAQKPPPHWKDFKIKVHRRDRDQTVSGATQSALYAAAFNVVSGIIRAALNHRIQSFGSQITKRVQCIIWEFQKCGINPFMVMPVNIHDEVDSVTHPTISTQVKEAVLKGVESFRDKVPMIKMKWDIGMKSWKAKD